MKKFTSLLKSNTQQHQNPAHEALVAQIGQRARNLYLTRQLLCTEAVVETINEALDGGLSKSRVVALTAPFCVALGESGCMCGALSGAVLASGLFLGDLHPYRNRKQMRAGARQLHDEFKARNGATCCNALTRQVKHDKTAHFHQCAGITENAAEMAARLILKNRPELATRSNGRFLARKQSVIGSTFSKIMRLLSN